MIKQLIVFVVLLIFLTSCSLEGKTTENPIESVENYPETTIVVEETVENSTTSTVDETKYKNENKIGAKSILNGGNYDEKLLLQRPIAIMIDNHPSARWQAGISKAEIMYECEVEYPYTRYMAIFVSESPEQLGPVR